MRRHTYLLCCCCVHLNRTVHLHEKEKDIWAHFVHTCIFCRLVCRSNLTTEFSSVEWKREREFWFSLESWNWRSRRRAEMKRERGTTAGGPLDWQLDQLRYIKSWRGDWAGRRRRWKRESPSSSTSFPFGWNICPPMELYYIETISVPRGNTNKIGFPLLTFACVKQTGTRGFDFYWHRNAAAAAAGRGWKPEASLSNNKPPQSLKKMRTPSSNTNLESYWL